MPKAKKNSKKRLSRSAHTVATLGFLTVSGLLVGCISLAYVFVAYPSFQVQRKPAVAGAYVSPWEKPILQSNAAIRPIIQAKSGILIDVDSAEILWARNADVARPLASLTKLAAIGAYLSGSPDLDALYTVPAIYDADAFADTAEPGASVLRISAGTRLPYRSLVAAALVSSANNAALALGEVVTQKNPDALQAYATNHGTRATKIVEASGLNPANVGSAHDLALLAHALFQWNIAQDMASVTTLDVPSNDGILHLRSTNGLINHSSKYTVVAGKTGYLVEAGYNLAVEVEKDGHKLLLVLLGAPSDDARVAGADALLQWAFTAHVWVLQK